MLNLKLQFLLEFGTYNMSSRNLILEMLICGNDSQVSKVHVASLFG